MSFGGAGDGKGSGCRLSLGVSGRLSEGPLKDYYFAITQNIYCTKKEPNYYVGRGLLVFWLFDKKGYGTSDLVQHMVESSLELKIMFLLL